MNMLAPMQDLGFGTIEEDASESSRTAQQEIVSTSEVGEGLSISIPAALLRIGPSFPPGLFPAVKSKSSYASFEMHSRLSEHMEALEQYTRCMLYTESDQISRKRLYQCFASMITLLTRHAWPSTYPVWFKSQVPELILPIMLWRLNPTAESHKYLSPCYRPTELQLTVPHSPIIDWVPYPSLRDRMILCYNGNVALDRMMCEYLNSHVVEVNEVSRILPHAPPGKGYFGVWNVYKGIYGDGQDKPEQTDLPISTSFLDVQPSVLDFSMYEDFGNLVSNVPLHDSAVGDCSPSPSLTHMQGRRKSSSASGRSGPLSVVELLSTPDLSLRVSHDLRLYEAKSWRVDMSFFRAYPELKFEGYEKITGQGRSFRMFTEPPDGPIPMTEATVKIDHNELARIA